MGFTVLHEGYILHIFPFRPCHGQGYILVLRSQPLLFLLLTILQFWKALLVLSSFSSQSCTSAWTCPLFQFLSLTYPGYMCSRKLSLLLINGTPYRRVKSCTMGCIWSSNISAYWTDNSRCICFCRSSSSTRLSFSVSPCISESAAADASPSATPHQPQIFNATQNMCYRLTHV